MICLMNETLLSIHKITKSVIFNSPSEFSINFLRNAFQIIEIGIQKVKPDISSRRITALVKASPPSRITHALIVRFAYNHSAYIKKDTLAKILISQQVVSTFDLEMLDKIASNPASGCVQEVVQYISKLMILDPLFGRSAAVLLKNILTKNPKKETVDWVCKLTKRFAMFIAMAVQKKKYLGRVSRVTECFVNTLAPNLIGFLT